MLRRNGPAIKSVESVLRPGQSLWWERFVKEQIITKPLMHSNSQIQTGLMEQTTMLIIILKCPQQRSLQGNMTGGHPPCPLLTITKYTISPWYGNKIMTHAMSP